MRPTDAMKVPSPHDLIVCVLPAQSSVRHFVLAAAAHVLVLCGAADAQSVPAAPSLSVWNALHLTHHTLPDATVTLERSADLDLWSVAGEPVYGSGESHSLLVPAGDESSGFLRLRTEVRPVIGKSRWDLQGSRLLLNSEKEVRLLTFGESGAGTAATAGSLTVFGWQWIRSGNDEGQLTLTMPDGLEETIEFQFTAANAGAYVSRRSRNGLPAGAAAGVFRDEPSSQLAASTPGSPGEASLVLSGTGRPICVSLSASGTAVVPDSTGEREFSASYEPTGEHTAVVTLSCDDGSVEAFTLTFTGPSCGSCTTHSTLEGRVRRTGSASFTIAPR
jgi:hypothetical protein